MVNKAAVAGVIVIGGVVVGLALALRSKAKGYTGQFTLAVSPALGSPLTSFQFTGTVPGATVGTDVTLFDSTGKQWDGSVLTTDSVGDFAASVSGFPVGSYSIRAESGSASSNTVSITVSPGTIEPLTVQPSIGSVLVEPGGDTIVILGVSAFGGVTPYTFSATWGDGDVESGNTTGVFQRTFLAGTTVETSALIEVASSDGQKASVHVTAS